MIHVGFVVDNNYCKYLAVTLASILKSSNEKDDYTFHIINDGSINDVSKAKLNELKKIRNFEIKYYLKKISSYEKEKAPPTTFPWLPITG